MSGSEATVSVQAPASAAGPGTVRHLAPGERLTFGRCRCDGCGFDLVVDGPGADPHLAGAVTALADHWQLHNLSPSAVLLARDLEDPGQCVRLMPGRVAVAMPFELAAVTSLGPWPAGITVFGPEPTSPPVAVRACQDRGPAVRLNVRASYFSVLRALCAPRLVGPAAERLPTSAELSARLASQGLALSPRAVDRHIDYLVERFGLQADDWSAFGRGWKREALAREAIRLGAVTEPAPAALREA